MTDVDKILEDQKDYSNPWPKPPFRWQSRKECIARLRAAFVKYLTEDKEAIFNASGFTDTPIHIGMIVDRFDKAVEELEK